MNAVELCVGVAQNSRGNCVGDLRGCQLISSIGRNRL